MSEKLPAPDASRITRTRPTEEELLVLPVGTRFVRVHPLGGKRPRRWNEMRTWGPTKSRFDHHVPPPHDQDRAIAYVSHGHNAFTAALAECFQDASGKGVGPVETVRRRLNMTVFDSAVDVVLLNLDSGWVTRAGGNNAISSGSRARAREWARAMYEAFGRIGSEPYIQGLAYRSSVWPPGQCAALWETAREVFPGSTASSRLLADPAFANALSNAAEELETYLV